MDGWGQYGSSKEHERYIYDYKYKSRKRRCSCGCDQVATKTLRTQTKGV